MSRMTILKRLLSRKKGTTSFEICNLVGTVCPHRRMTDLRQQGWEITKKPVPGKNFNRYFGKPPKGQK